jgi:hypothetical protein
VVRQETLGGRHVLALQAGYSNIHPTQGVALGCAIPAFQAENKPLDPKTRRFTVLCHQFLPRFTFADDIDWPVAGRHQLLVGIDAEAVIDRVGQVLDCQPILIGLAGGGVGLAVDQALLDSAAQ